MRSYVMQVFRDHYREKGYFEVHSHFNIRSANSRKAIFMFLMYITAAYYSLIWSKWLLFLINVCRVHCCIYRANNPNWFVFNVLGKVRLIVKYSEKSKKCTLVFYRYCITDHLDSTVFTLKITYSLDYTTVYQKLCLKGHFWVYGNHCIVLQRDIFEQQLIIF